MMTKKECATLFSPLLKVALPTISINRHFPRVMVHAPLSMNGLAVPNIYVEQGIQHLQRMVEHTLNPYDIIGHLLTVSVEQLSIEMGSDTDIFSLPYVK